MVEPGVRTLLGGVRRHLWRERGRVAVRRAGWLSAATMLLAGTVHVAGWPIAVDAVAWLVALEWASLLVSVAWRRPTDAESALWIDRHLGGASAFTTLLDPAPSPQTPAHAQALRWLEQWTAANLAGVRRALGEQRSSVRVSRSLLAMAVCSALALFALSLTDTTPTLPRRADVAAAPASGDKPTGPVEAPVAAQLASEIATALRSTDLSREPDRRRPSDAPATGPTRADDGSAARATASRAASLPADAATARESSSPGAVDARASAGTGRSADAVSGHDAGDSPDARVERGVSRAAAGTIAQPRPGSTLALAGGERQADMEQAAGFDESATAGGAISGAVVAAPAATPPRAVAAARLSSAETSYVEAWMKAMGRSR